MPTSDIKKGPLYVDSTNNSVGIGTTTNNQSSSTASVTLNAASGMSAYELRNADVFSGYVGNTGTNMYLVNAKNGSLGLYTNNAEVVRVETGGLTLNPATSNLYTVSGALSYYGTTNNVYLNGASSGGMIMSGNGNRNQYVYLNSVSDSVSITTNTLERLGIDSSGRVTMPYQPAFSAINGAGNNGVAYPIPFTTAVTNVGGYYNTSNYRFTAPVAGTYFFMHNAMSNGGYNRTRYKVNGSYVGNEFFSPNVGYANFVGNIILTLAVNDYVEIFNDVQASGQGDIHNDYRAFSGFLIG